MKRYILIIILVLFSISVAWILRENKKILRSEELLSEAAVEVLPVNVKAIERRDIHETLTFTGILEPRRKLMVISQTQGLVEDVFFELGDYVEEGRVVLQVENDLLAAQLEVTRANYEKAQKDIVRFEKMAEIDGVTQDQLEKMRLNLENAEAKYIAARKQLENSSIEAPFNGYINQVFTKEGSMMGPGAPVFELVDLTGFKMTIKCTEDEISHIAKGMNVVVRPKFLEEVVLSGSVSKLSVSADMAQQFTVEISIRQPSETSLKGGMIAEAEILGREWEDIIAVNSNTILDKDGKNYVYKVVDERAVQTEIDPGTVINDMVEVREGLKPGDIIVVSSISQLSDGKKVKIVE